MVITDEGAADGSTLQASLWAVRKERPARLIVAVPVGSIDALMGLADDADETIALKVPPVLRSVGRFYVRFEKTTDEEVVEALRTSARGLHNGKTPHHDRRRDLGHSSDTCCARHRRLPRVPNLAVANVIKRSLRKAAFQRFCPATVKLKAQSPPGRHRLGQRYRPGISDTGHSGTGG